MKPLFALVAIPSVVVVAILSLTLIFLRSESTSESTTESISESTSKSTSKLRDCRYYVIPVADDFDTQCDFGRYESSDSLGVPAEIVDDHNDLAPSFLQIGEDTPSRFQFLVDRGAQPSEDLYWMTEVHRVAQQPNGEKRILVLSTAGTDATGNTSRGLGFLVQPNHQFFLAELWQSNAEAGLTLIERIRIFQKDSQGRTIVGFNGLQSSHESPLEFYTGSLSGQ